VAAPEQTAPGALLPPLIRLLSTQPTWLAEHAEAYAALLASEVSGISQRWARQALLGFCTLAALAVAAVLGGVALMLYLLASDVTTTAALGLLGVPVFPLLLAVACAWAARGPEHMPPWTALLTEWRADMALLRSLGPA
jgi:hypothetical protein